MYETKGRNMFLLWFGVAISIAEILTGMLVAPLGWKQGLWSIILGHIIGCGLFLLPAAYMSGRKHRSAIGVTELTFGQVGVKLFSLLNAIQLIGWTAVMIVNAQIAMNEVSGYLFHFKSILTMTIIVTILISLWLLMDHEWLFKINNRVVILLALGILLLIGSIMTTSHQLVNPVKLGKISFGAAVELSVTMCLSWLPVIGDSTQNERYPQKVSLASICGYFLGGCSMFAVGLLIVLKTGQKDLMLTLLQTNLGLVALFIIIFSTVTTTFMDAYSAVQSLQILFPRLTAKTLSLLVMVIGFVLAIGVSMHFYENFLSLIGAVFTPLFAILFISIFVLKKRLARVWNFVWWLVGSLAYYGLQRLDFILGTTFLLLLVLSLGVYVTSIFTKTYSLQ
ncbi:putative hydroxymethylpyrimidine transporter CytX [Bombilactobacillus folatiphilus]|uniref:Hydroxymethylpyrimidine transporter CytX n=1 Tax=Bombilactobacillus folatiphilus TaxID=2923362 RepID=A0ABY4P7M2_9LACO|nr:putative hydroxymethylpyrimidine transporter CytX [Bombilactobacillus folatiphilus]UQS81638.1 putative hydroxymethylpyrimidine transporter CytX [Bombilactobacillus folatiphilus]